MYTIDRIQDEPKMKTMVSHTALAHSFRYTQEDEEERRRRQVSSINTSHPQQNNYKGLTPL
jgi:hypothetical protein